MIQHIPSKRRKQWPDDPYKGLTFYSPDDVPLFAGREDDKDAMASMIGVGTTRIVLLHGMTGCGKSSFLRAGLIPALEEELAGYEFLRDSNGQPDFIRSTEHPTASIARMVHQAIRRKNLDILLPPEEAEFVKSVSDDPELLVRAIEQFASNVRRTLVLVVDQTEEVITLKPDSRGDNARFQFFDFLADISRSKHDLKLIVAFRTEYHGQFYAQLRYGADVSRINDYFLAEFNRSQIMEAILRPTIDEVVPGYGKPRDKYNFVYEADLPGKIADAVLNSGVSGGVLPVLQIVCRRLYEGVKPSIQAPPAGPALITERRFTDVGGISGQVNSHIQMELEAALKQKFARENVSFLTSERETARWRVVLSKLAKPQVNGTVTTDTERITILHQNARDEGCRVKPEFMFPYLVDHGILRTVDVTMVDTKDVVKCYSLGHDVLAGALIAWKVERRFKARTIWLGRVFYALVAVGFVGGYFFGGRNPALLITGLLSGLVALLLFLPSVGQGFADAYGRMANLNIFPFTPAPGKRPQKNAAPEGTDQAAPPA